MTRSLVLAALFLLVDLPVRAQYGSASHTVTVSVSSITVLQLSAGAVNLNVSGASVAAGQDLMTVTSDAAQLLWGTNSSLKKITVQTNLLSPQYALKIEAVNPTKGTAAAQVTVASVARDLMLNIGRSSGTATLRYSAEALASQGTGTDSHTLTFTIQNQ